MKLLAPMVMTSFLRIPILYHTIYDPTTVLEIDLINTH